MSTVLSLLDRVLAAGWGVPLLAHDHPSFSGATPLMWAVWIASGVVTLWTIWLAVRTTLHPGETDAGHAKRSILDDDRRMPILLLDDHAVVVHSDLRGGDDRPSPAGRAS